MCQAFRRCFKVWVPLFVSPTFLFFLFLQVDALNHECPGTSVEASQVSVEHSCFPFAYLPFCELTYQILQIYCPTVADESLIQHVEGGVGQGPWAQSASVENCLLCLGSWLHPPSMPPLLPLSLLHSPPLPRSLSLSLAPAGPYAQYF